MDVGLSELSPSDLWMEPECRDVESAISKSSGKLCRAINIIIELCLLLPCTFLNTHNRL